VWKLCKQAQPRPFRVQLREHCNWCLPMPGTTMILFLCSAVRRTWMHTLILGPILLLTTSPPTAVDFTIQRTGRGLSAYFGHRSVWTQARACNLC
jgi:hypothetical protein